MKIKSLGPYKIVRRIGRGGMGTVFQGRDPATGEAAAVKVLSTSLALDFGFRERFQAEIESLRKLRHPNIVRLHGFGQQDDVMFYAMELVEGLSLEEELESGRRFDWRETAQIGIQVCRALKHAHDRGVIHRDLKPANLLLTDAGLVKLSDFGIAKLFGQVSQTAAGGILGTAEYMAPEQADGRPVSDRADLYSLGGVLYALLARRAPFRASTLPEMLQLQRFADPDPVRRYAPDAPVEMEQIIAQLLEKDPQKRIPTALVVMRRLEAMQQVLSVPRANGNESAAAADPFIATSPTVTAAENLDEVARREAIGQRQPALSPPPLAADQSAAEELRATDGAEDAAVEPIALPNTEAPRLDDAPPADVEQQASVEEATVRFTTVADDDHAAIEPVAPSTPPIVSWHTAVLIVGLLAVGWGAWSFLQPPDPDKLYRRIMAAAREDTDALVEVEDDVEYLLSQHFSDMDDPRRAELLMYQERIELERLERRLARRARRSLDDGSLLPVERAYLEAIRLMEYDQAQGLARMEATIDLYEHGSESSPTARRLIELARRRVAEHRQTNDESVADELAAVTARLIVAEQLGETDPAKSRRICQAVIDLYGDKPWAAEAVARARDMLTTSVGPSHTAER